MIRRAPKAATIAVAVALAACGSGTPTVVPPPTTQPTPPPTTVPPTPTTFADLSATVISPQAGQDMNCDGDVRGRITITNRGGTSVTIQGILNRSAVVAGVCSPGDDFTYTPLTRTAAANATTVVLDRSLFPGGLACCLGRGCAGACRFLESFEVITNLGHVPAGEFTYQVFFQNCPSCLRASGTTGRACRPTVAVRRALADSARGALSSWMPSRRLPPGGPPAAPPR